MRYCILSSFIFLSSCANEEHKTPVVSKNQPITIHYSDVESGDIILKKGYGFVSNLITETLGETNHISHCGMFWHENNKLYVIHAISKEYSNVDGVQKTPVDTFLLDCEKNTVQIVRPLISVDQRKIVAQKALSYAQKSTPFDYQFDYQDNSKMYCTELLYCALKDHVSDDFFSKKMVNKTEIISFHAFLDSNFVSFVKKL